MAKDITEPAIRENTGRNPDGTFMQGVSGNPSGRPKNALKDYMRLKFNQMSNDEKDEFLKTVSHETQWKMAEGNPESIIDSDITTLGDKLPSTDLDALAEIMASQLKENKT